MAISSIHIEAGKLGFFVHNSRERETKNTIFNDEQNYCSCNSKTAFELYRAELLKRSSAYTTRTNQKLQKNTVTHLSAILNFNPEHTKEDIEKVCQHLEKKLDTKVIQMAMHRDEGHFIEDESKEIHESIGIKNYHAHIEMMGIDTQGDSIRRKLDKPFLKQLQTDTARLLNMQRGQESGYTKEEYQKVIEKIGNPAQYSSKEEYKKRFNEIVKDYGFQKERSKPVKRLGTYEFKYHKEEETRRLKQERISKKYKKQNGENATKDEVIKFLERENKVLKAENEDLKKELAKQKDLKEEISKLREELKGKGAVREDYASLEQLNKDLKAQIKEKDLTLDELENSLEKWQRMYYAKFDKVQDLQKENQKLQQNIKTIKKVAKKRRERYKREEKYWKDELSSLRNELQKESHNSDRTNISTGEIIGRLKTEVVLQANDSKKEQKLSDSKTENEVVDNRRPNWKKPLNLGVL